MSHKQDRVRRYLDPATLARLGGLELRARSIVEGLHSGRHRSPYRGFSVEFAEHRKYSQGDDLRHLDWRVLGRTDKHYVKQYDQETNLQLMLVVDCSASMGYRSDSAALTKREYAATLAASLAYMVLHQADAVGLAVFFGEFGRVVRASSNPQQWKTVIETLEAAPAQGATSLRRALDQVADQLTRRHVVIVMSDLFDDPDAVLAGLRHLRHRRHETIVMHVMDPAELDFPFSQVTRFEGLEEDVRLLTQPRVIRERYLAEVRTFLDTIRRGCHENRIDYTLFNTSESIDRALSGYLANRAGRPA